MTNTKHIILNKITALFSLTLLVGGLNTPSFGQTLPKSNVVHMVFTSDAHYGIKRKFFRGDSNVVAHTVNAAMIEQINTLPQLTLPEDEGIAAGTKISAVDYLIEAGDIANRMEIPNQTAAASWAQFETDYLNGVKLKGHNGRPAQFLILPGNHDISNAIGYYRPMQPLTDPSSMVNIYNLMMKPKIPLNNANYDYNKHKINYSRNVAGVHMIFVTLWPDSVERIWMAKDLDTVGATTPVIIFSHDQPMCEAIHFTNPIAPHKMSAQNRFENLTAEYYKEASIILDDKDPTDIEQRGLTKFLKAHPNIKAYFHGNTHISEFYDYTGPDRDIDLKVFRVDSPMKGKYSNKDERLLSFLLVSLDPAAKKITVRECLWNTKPAEKNQPIVFGKSRTIAIMAAH